MRTTLPLVLASALAAGCVSGSGNITYYEIFVDRDTETTCEDTIQHNYVDGTEWDDADPGDWTYEDMWEGSPDTVWMKLFDIDHTDYDMIALIDCYEFWCVKDGKNLDCERDSWSESTDSETHADGYAYTVFEALSSVWSFSFEFDGNMATGSMDLESEDTTTWTETDTWPDTVPVYSSGQTPVYYYLHDGDEFGLYNYYDQAECSSSNCELTVTETCTASADISLYRTDLDDLDCCCDEDPVY